LERCGTSLLFLVKLGIPYSSNTKFKVSGSRGSRGSRQRAAESLELPLRITLLIT
jgi:hypothetical protein